MRYLVLDSGALIGFERSDRRTVGHISRAMGLGEVIAVPTPVVAQVWRDGRTQARLARLLASDACNTIPLDDLTARTAGEICRISGTTDVVDATVVAVARGYDAPVLTSDSDDLRRLDPTLQLVQV